MHLDPAARGIDDDAIDHDVEHAPSIGERQKQPRLSKVGEDGFDPSGRFLGTDAQSVGASLSDLFDHMLLECRSRDGLGLTCSPPVPVALGTAVVAILLSVKTSGSGSECPGASGAAEKSLENIRGVAWVRPEWIASRLGNQRSSTLMHLDCDDGRVLS